VYRNTAQILLGPSAWEAEIREKNPILKKYYERRQFDRYITTAALLGLSYREYVSQTDYSGYIYAPYVPIAFVEPRA
jgi:hypothetical protein